MSRQALGGKDLQILFIFLLPKLQVHFMKLLPTLLIPPSKVTQLADTLSYTNTHTDTQMQKKALCSRTALQAGLAQLELHKIQKDVTFTLLQFDVCYKKGGLPRKVTSKFFTAGFTLQGTRQSRPQILSGGFKKINKNVEQNRPQN